MNDVVNIDDEDAENEDDAGVDDVDALNAQVKV